MYDPKSEERWNAYWRSKRMFLFDRDDKERPIYVIDTPPPNPTGGMHMGHASWTVYIDTLARYKRLKGYNVMYPQGWDTQGFPIELEVEKRYGREMPREEFYKRCVELANSNIKEIKSQMIRLGATFDESLEYVTMSDDYRRKVQLSLIENFKGGYVYRGIHPIEWCPRCMSSIAREEVREVESETTLNYIRFVLKGKKGSKEHEIEIATTRPEMLHACVALAVGPNDERYTKFLGKSVIVPIFGTEVPVISDESIRSDFGTGAEMVCTFGDKNDISIYYRKKLNHIDAIDEGGRLKNAGKFSGMDAEKAREAVIEELRSEGHLIRSEGISHTVKVHDRCSAKIELISKMQWFIKTKEFASKIKESAASIKWYPESSQQRLIDWVDYIEWDWNISRSRIFGTPIPFWYCVDCNEIIVPKTDMLPVNPAYDKPPNETCPKCGSSNITGEREVCDVWVDSTITPLVISGWPDDKSMYKRAFPTSIRIQGTDIVRTWAFYTIFRTWTLTKQKPFDRIIVNPMILNEQGREMHKSEGTGISPEDLVEKYSIDSVRLWVVAGGGIGRDRPFSYAEMEHMKSFIVKLYNSAIFVKNALDDIKPPKEEPHKSFGIFDLWILNRLNSIIRDVDKDFESLNLYDASSKLINFYWHEFCDYYIENVKYRIREGADVSQGNRHAAAYTLLHVLNTSLTMLSPIIPHVAEEVNSMFKNESVFEREFPVYKPVESRSDYVINGLIFKSALPEADNEDAGAFLNIIIGEVRKEKARMRIALNREITRININVPEAYYTVVSIAKKELESICKARDLSISKDKELSVSIEI